MVKEVFSESGRDVSFISDMPNLSGTSVLASHFCASRELSARHPSSVRTANITTFPIQSLFLVVTTESLQKIACKPRYLKCRLW